MPVLKSSLKNLRHSQKNAIRNKSFKTRVKEQIKNIQKLLVAGNKEEAAALAPKVTSLIDRSAKKNIIHKNKAARQKSGLARLLAAK